LDPERDEYFDPIANKGKKGLDYICFEMMDPVEDLEISLQYEKGVSTH